MLNFHSCQKRHCKDMSNRILSIALIKSNLKPSGFTRLDLKSLVKNTNISKFFAITEYKIQ